MKRKFLAAIMVFVSLALIGCGNDHSSAPPPPSTITTQILSDPALDGYILSQPGVFTTAQNNTQRVFAGIDPLTPLEEDRAFLDFPLSTVPLNASIVSATLIIFINDIQPKTGAIPILIEPVSFSSLSGFDFDSAPLSTTSITFPIFQTDINDFVSVDVTSLMTQAQILSLPDFQIRILLDFSATSGRIEINDTTGPNRAALAPLLVVEFI